MRLQLRKLFYPQSIAVIGASERAGSVGKALMENLVASKYQGRVFPINLKHRSIFGRKVYRYVSQLEKVPDLCIIATPAETVAGLVRECGQKQVEAVVIISAGFKEAGLKGTAMFAQILEYSREFNIRILGPNCLGFINTHLDLNATFARRMALKGNVAFLSQSGALCTSILDWSVTQNVGFSHLISIGSTLDLDFHDLIDFLGSDPQTNCILIYMESLKNAREFMSAARAYARSKPIIVLKAGKSKEGAIAALSHTGSLAGNDLVFDAAFKRAGILRVDTIAELFHCAQALSMHASPKGNRLAIITNAGGPGILATDYLMEQGGQLPTLSEETVYALNQVLSFSWSHKNPIDILGDATPEHYEAAIRACMHAENIDGILVILTPQDVTDTLGVARVVAGMKKDTSKPIFASWMGEEDVQAAREILEQHKIPHYRFPERAVDVFLKIYSYFRHIELLYEFTPATPEDFVPAKDKALKLIDSVLQQGRNRLDEYQAKTLLSYYDIPVNLGRIAASEEEAVTIAQELGFPVVMKISSPDIAHKTDLGGVRLYIDSETAVRKSYQEILNAIASQNPNAHISGILVERMVNKDTELLIGSSYDPIFGPVILFGMGGIAVEIFKDRSIALPPLNMSLAKRLIEDTLIYQILRGYRNLPGIDMEDLQFLIIKFAYLVMDFPEIREIDINPFAIDQSGGLVLDANIILHKGSKRNKHHPYQHLVISPYPSHYERTVALKNGQKVKLRPIRPEDEPLEAALFERLSKDTIYFRFFGYSPHIDHAVLSRFTHIDYDREMAIVAEVQEAGKPKLLGVVRIIADPWNDTAEYAIVVADAWHGLGLGSLLTDFIIEIARERGINTLVGDVLAGNQAMISLFKRRDFKFTQSDPTEWHVVKDLRS